MSWLLDAFAWLGDGAHWRGELGIPRLLLQHVGVSAAALGIACLLALPLAVWLGHVGRGGALAVAVSNAGRAVPTYAVLVLLYLATLPVLDGGTPKTVIALVLFAVPPILTNAYVGMREVDRDAVEAARGMGMGGWDVVRQVELPLAVPLVLDGVRLAAVQVVATATIAALVGVGGLGRIVVQGFGLQDQAQVVAGALLVGALALLVEGGFALLQRRVDPVARAQRGARTSPVRLAAGAGLEP